jgi:branched-chain amino acid transport system ATP-binding protein
MTTDREILRIDGVHLRYGPVTALQGLSLSVSEASICAVLGANGAGKSSTLRCIAGLEAPNSGAIHYRGEEIGGRPAHEAIGRGIALVPEGRRIYAGLTVLENLQCGYHAAGSRGTRRMLVDARVSEILELFPELSDRLKQKGGSLSGGQQQMLAVARGLMSAPRLLILDEPSLGVAPTVVSRLYERLRALRETGVTILLVEQFAKLALEVADHAVVIANGAAIFEGPPDALADNSMLVSTYLS